MQRVDIHQHVWTTPLLDALARRDAHPFVRRDDGLCVLHLAGELPCVIDEPAEAPFEGLEDSHEASLPARWG